MKIKNITKPIKTVDRTGFVTLLSIGIESWITFFVQRYRASFEEK